MGESLTIVNCLEISANSGIVPNCISSGKHEMTAPWTLHDTPHNRTGSPPSTVNLKINENISLVSE